MNKQELACMLYDLLKEYDDILIYKSEEFGLIGFMSYLSNYKTDLYMKDKSS